MKYRLTEVFMLEAKCPRCGDPGAYVGANAVECPNPGCVKHDPKMKKSAKGSHAWPLEWPSGEYEQSVEEFKGEYPEWADELINKIDSDSSDADTLDPEGTEENHYSIVFADDAPGSQSYPMAIPNRLDWPVYKMFGLDGEWKQIKKGSPDTPKGWSWK